MADQEGFRTMGVPKEYGGTDQSILNMCIVGEEFGVGDLGFAVIMDQCWKMSHLFKDAMNKEQKDRFIPQFVRTQLLLQQLVLLNQTLDQIIKVIMIIKILV